MPQAMPEIPFRIRFYDGPDGKGGPVLSLDELPIKSLKDVAVAVLQELRQRQENKP